MDVRDWALVVFTILSQMAAGSFIVLMIVHAVASYKIGREEADRLSAPVFPAIILVLGAGLLASLGHLGDPLNAPLSVTNVGRSWLSREVLSGVLFFVVGGVFAVMQWFKIASLAVRSAIGWFAALIGFATVYMMSNIYMMPTEPAWDTLATPFMFFTTAFLLGSLAVGVALVAHYAYLKRHRPESADVQHTFLRSVIRWIALAAIGLLGVEFVVYPVYLAVLATGPQPSVESASLMLSEYGPILGLRLALVFIGAGVLGLFLYQSASSAEREKITGRLTYSAFVLVLAGEVMGRFLFYASHVRLGLL
jgi:anaerobic dimethyl sulfoxide reductase subunit C (anchor subunit)